MYGLMVGFSVYLVAGQLDATQKTVESERPAAWRRSTVCRAVPRLRAAEDTGARRVVREDRRGRGVPTTVEQGRPSKRAAEIGNEFRRSVVGFEPSTGG
jgi:hypothetical protein